MLEKILDLNNSGRFGYLANHIKNRCAQLNITVPNRVLLCTLGEFKDVIGFKLLGGDFYPIFDNLMSCWKCQNPNSVKQIQVINTQNEQNHTYQDCEFCLSGLHDFIISNDIESYRIENHNFNEYFDNRMSTPIQLLFKKAFEHYYSAKQLINNPLTLEQGVVNFSECMEKILKAISLIHGSPTEKIHNLPEMLLKTKIHYSYLPYFNLKLLRELSLAYDVLRYKDQEMKLNSQIVINATGIEIEMDYFISLLKNQYIILTQNSANFNVLDVWHEAANMNHFLIERNFWDRLNLKSTKHHGRKWVRENKYFEVSTNSSKVFHIEHNYQTLDPIDFFVKIDTILPNSYDEYINKISFSLADNTAFVPFINHSMYRASR